MSHPTFEIFLRAVDVFNSHGPHILLPFVENYGHEPFKLLHSDEENPLIQQGPVCQEMKIVCV